MKIKIVHLFPQLLNLYGDKGNINALCKRLTWRDIEAEVKCINTEDEFDISDADIIFIGGGTDSEQVTVCQMLEKKKDEISDYVENNGVMLATCGGYHMLGASWQTDNETVSGLGILDVYTEQGDDRLMGNVIIESPAAGCKITGFENHSGRTYSNLPPLGETLFGNGNNGKDKTEGAIYKNVIGTNLHGPVLPANPQLTDFILSKALEKKYGDVTLSPLDDTAENKAREYIIDKYL